MGLFLDVIVPAIPVLARLEERGIPLHAKCTESCPPRCGSRDNLRAATQARLDAACAKIAVLAQDMHAKRIERTQGEIARLERELAEYRDGLSACPDHPKQKGLSTASKKPCCTALYASRKDARDRIAEIRTIRNRYKNKLKQIGPQFDAENDWHWRFLLFDELGLNLEPATYTEVTDTMRERGIEVGTPKVDEDAIERLQRRYPDIELLGLRVDISETRTRLSTRLAVEPWDDGRVHTPYSISRTWNLRVSSGNDPSESDKSREGAGNMQNLPKRDRMMYRAEPGHWFIQPDLSQVEARAQAWIARDIKMLRAWRDGLDIHAMTAAAIYGVPEAETKTRLVKIAGHWEPMRQMGKKRRHGGNYGMGDKKFADMTGIPLSEAHRISAIDREVWPRLYAFQKEEVERATREKCLRNEFGYMVRFYSFRQRDGKWEIEAREEALSFRPASDVACMIISMLPEIDAIPGGELLTTTHDSYLIQVPLDTRAVIEYTDAVRKIMTREWPEFGRIEEFGYFKCPVDIKVGLNWGDRHVCKPECPNRRDPNDVCDDHNPDGLEDFDKWLASVQKNSSGQQDSGMAKAAPESTHPMEDCIQSEQLLNQETTGCGT